jgi:hypothetical protein
MPSDICCFDAGMSSPFPSEGTVSYAGSFLRVLRQISIFSNDFISIKENVPQAHSRRQERLSGGFVFTILKTTPPSLVRSDGGVVVYGFLI